MQSTSRHCESPLIVNFSASFDGSSYREGCCRKPRTSSKGGDAPMRALFAFLIDCGFDPKEARSAIRRYRATGDLESIWWAFGD